MQHVPAGRHRHPQELNDYKWEAFQAIWYHLIYRLNSKNER